MIPDAITYAKRCHACQVHGDFIHQAPGYLRSTTSTWPFEMWGIDVIGPISPPSSKGHRFILAITDYFSKWVEAIPLREVKSYDVIKFVKHHVIYRFGVPRRIVHDNGPQFVSQAFQRFCTKLRIQSVSSTAYYPPLMVSQKLSTRPLASFSRNSSRKVSVTGTTSWVNAYGPIAQLFEPQQKLHHFLWYMGVKPCFH